MSFRGEMEWEFAENEGEFRTTGKVVNYLRTHLARGEIESAVKLYESCAENVGDDLMAEFPTASTALQKAMANLFFRARDYRRAATACEQLAEWEAAARSYEAAYAYPQAARCYVRAQKQAKAAAVFIKAGHPRKALELYLAARDFAGAGAAAERLGDLMGAARYALSAQDPKTAARRLALVPPTDPAFAEASTLLADVLVEIGHGAVAVQRLATSLPPSGKVEDPGSAAIAYKLGEVLVSLGRHGDAERPFRMVADYDPLYRDVGERLAAPAEPPPIEQLATAAVTVPPVPAGAQTTAPPAASPVAAVVVTGEPESAVDASTVSARRHPGTPLPISPEAMSAAPASPSVPPAPASDPFSALDGPVFHRPRREAPSRAASMSNIDVMSSQAFVSRLEDYELLKPLPIFETLSLDEMQAFYHLCETVRFEPGEALIEEGQPGEALYIVREGDLVVTQAQPEGEPLELARIGAGNYVGEMSLIDDAPTSATVAASSPVTAFRIRKDAFHDYLYSHDLVALRVYKSFTATLAARLREANARKKS